LGTPGNEVIVNYTDGSKSIPTHVYGGFSASGNIEGNKVNLISGTVSSGVYGGYSMDGTATGNTVTMSGGTIGDVTGGYSNDSGNAANNTVTVSGDATVDVGSVTGGHSNAGNATNNTVSMGGNASVSGGVTGGNGNGSGNATGNTVSMRGNARVSYGVTGGNTNGSGHATGNTVNISDNATIEGWTYGGYSNGSGNAANNTVNINGDAVVHYVSGGSSAGNVTDNTVNISGNARVTGAIYGGDSYSDNGDVINNTVNISGNARVTGAIYGGYSFGSDTIGNTVALSGNANISDVTTLYGGERTFFSGDKRSGNTLHINHWKGSTQAAIANFENYRFTLPASTIGSGEAVLTTSGGVDLGSNANVSTHFMGIPAAALQVGQQAILIAASSAINNSGALVNTSVPSTLGATDYTFDVALENGDTALVATLASKQVNQNKAGAYLYGASARLAALTSGADHVVSLLDNWQHSPATPTSAGFRSFVSIQGSSIKTRTGSSVNNNGASFALGGAFDTATRLGTLTTGVFAEGGIGRYNSYSRFGWGDGDTWHYGIGAFAKHAFTNSLYLEGSARIGRAKTDFDGKGSVSDLHYNSEGNYWGAHAGVGIDYPLTNVSSMDTYAKLLWTHQDSDAVTTRAKERLSFDSADSLRSRIGIRYRHRVEENLRAHVGVGWEYEFDGKARAKLDGTKIAHEPETQGHSALVEAGIEWRATKSWSVNANATAMGGQRKGLAGYAQATYRF
jgi:outer membrane autotransporter protein